MGHVSAHVGCNRGRSICKYTRARNNTAGLSSRLYVAKDI